MLYKYKYFFLFIFSFILIYQGCQSKDDNAQKSQTLSRSSMTGEISYETPDGWIKETPGGSMRKAQYRLPGAEGAGDAEMGVFVFPGGGGAVQANINRWLGQFKQPDGSDSREKAQIKELESNGLHVSIIYVTGTHIKGSMMGGSNSELKDYAMVAAIVETSTDPWFFKTVGPQVTIDKWRSDFEKFAGTFKQE